MQQILDALLNLLGLVLVLGVYALGGAWVVFVVANFFSAGWKGGTE